MIDHEVEEINKILERVLCGSKIITCIRSLIRVNLKQTQSRQITVCIRFPADYPNGHLLVELKSLTLSERLIAGLTTLAEQRAIDFLGKPQTLHVLKSIDNYLRENSLCAAYDEIAAIKKLLREKSDLCIGGGDLKCSQKLSNVTLTINGGDYFYKGKFHISDEYPTECIALSEHKTNFPDTLVRFLNGQTKEIARRCVEAPLRISDKYKFIVKPSLLPSLSFLIDAVVDLHNEVCPVCEIPCLPANASDVELKDTADRFVGRVYCGHIYHLGCLKKYMREPPFPSGGKVCPAKKAHPHSDQKAALGHSHGAQSKNRKSNELNKGGTCGIRISHDRWALNVKLAEARWAQQQARERELEEVKDFLQ